MSSNLRIVLAGDLSTSAADRLRVVGELIEVDPRDEAALVESVRNADALVVRTTARVTRKVIEAGGRLKVIGRAGVGLDNVDLSAARERGISVVYTPAASTRAVAEMTVGLILAVERHLVAGDAMVRDGRFLEARRSFLSRELHECTLGIVGMGRIGQAVATICARGLGMRVIYNDIEDIEANGVDAEAMRSKVDLYASADVLTLHVPLTDATRGMIDAEALGQFKTGATLINTSRGAVLDADAVAKSLIAGKLGGLGVDVFDEEPPGIDHPLLHAPRVSLTPHLSSRTPGALERMNDVVDDVIRVLGGERPMYAAWA